MCTYLDDTPADLPDTGGWCCEGSVIMGAAYCTCWEEVYDLDQAEPDPLAVRLLAAGVEPSARRTRCADCAYRPGSPERRSEEGAGHDADSLEEIAAGGGRFFCHEGMRRVIQVRHPLGLVAAANPGAYRPPGVDGVPYRADGQPGLLCAGWVARSRHHAALAGLAKTAGDPA